MTLNSSNPFDFPIVDPAYLSTDFDIFAITKAVKAAQRFMAASPWQGFVLGQFGNFANVTTDEQIAAYVRNNAASVFHPTSTAFMSAANAKNGVVNPDLTVKNTVGLRVVDASVFVSDYDESLRAGSASNDHAQYSPTFHRCILRVPCTSLPNARQPSSKRAWKL